jgi:predicted CoA-binding protein
MDCPMPTINTNDDKTLKAIFESTQTIAIVGLSPDPEKPSHQVARYLQNAGYTIIPIYPKGEEILGEKVYHSLEKVDIPIDMVDMFRKPDVAHALVEQIKLRSDVKCLWLQLGIVNNEAVEKAKELGLQVVQNKCTKIEHQRIFAS